ncbi:MAG: hypothetical protein OHK006_21060 [Thermodesulfovibrionales bacterium]
MKNRIQRSSGRNCPCVEKPFEECFCNHMNSQKVEDTLKYCSSDFRSCEIFRKRIAEIREMYPSVMGRLAPEA